MLSKVLFVLSFVISRANGFWNLQFRNNSHPAFDSKLYEAALDPVECQKQLNYIKDDAIPGLMLADASAKFPSGLFEGNLMDLGNYHQCLSINYKYAADDSAIEGKYCLILFDVLDVLRLMQDPESLENKEKLRVYKSQSVPNAYMTRWLKENTLPRQIEIRSENGTNHQYDWDLLSSENLGNFITSIPRGAAVASLGMCVPKVCTSYESVNFSTPYVPGYQIMNYNQTFNFTEAFCRLPNDKPWTPADTVAVIVFSIIGVLTLICSSYDVIWTFILKRDSNNNYLKIFSLYTNGRRLNNFSSSSNQLRCLDGIRVLSTLWVVLGHSYTHQDKKNTNPIDMLTWTDGMESLLISSAPLAVDTFFTMTGILLVYNTCTKVNQRQLFKSLPVFYLSRMLRLFPLLAAVVLLQASFFHRMSDGPIWTNVAKATDDCRTAWWITLSYIHNLIDNVKCLNHAWYISLDVQLYILSPLVLFWVLGSKKSAWIALTASLAIVLTLSGVFNFEHNFLVNIKFSPVGLLKYPDFRNLYYANIITRASPYLVGMVFGYILHLYRDTQTRLVWHSVVLLWCSIITLFICMVLSMFFVRQEYWTHQVVDNLLNTFMRPFWATCVGWIVFASEHGYGGPINWFLSLDMWRLPSRLSYGVYLFHLPIISILGDAMSTVEYFTPGMLFCHVFMSIAPMSFIVSYFATILIDAPFTLIFKRMLEKDKIKESTKL